jgi:hypothetical protein
MDKLPRPVKNSYPCISIFFRKLALSPPPLPNRQRILERLEFIEFRLFWEGRVNRSDLTRQFEISVPHASSDLTRYQELAPGNLRYDKTLKTYVAADGFRPRFLRPNSERYLAELRMITAGLEDPAESWSAAPEHDSVRPPSRRTIESEILRKILTAIRTEQRIKIRYHSRSAPEARWRWISPHAVAFDGERWHARSWCHDHHDFRDFVFNRVLAATELRPSPADPKIDFEWSRSIELVLAPNPALHEAARKAFELDYGMRGGELRVTTRISLARYYEWRYGLDLVDTRHDPLRYPIVLLNKDELYRARDRAREDSRIHDPSG